MRADKTEEQERLLSSWKEIAGYLGRTIRTCQRFEREMGLPVHRLDGSPKAHVFAYRNELDAWLAQKADEHKQGRPGSRRLILYGLAGLTVFAAAAVLIIALKPGRTPRSIAVMPFDDLSAEPGSVEMAAGLTEDITNGLAHVRGLQVAGRTTAAVIRRRDLDARETGRALNVRYLLEGSTQAAGQRLRVTARLVDARNGFQLWTETYDRQKEDFFEVKDGITKSVVDRLGIILSAGEESALRKRPTADMQAYEYYLTGRYLLGRPWPQTPEEALHFFDQALGRDPKFALAYVGIGWAYTNMIAQFLARPNDVGPKAEDAAKKALALAPDLPEAIALDAWVQYLYRFQWDAGEKGLAKALGLKPDDAMIRGWHALTLLTLRRTVEARAEIKRALASDPLMPVLSAYSMWIHLFTRRFDEVLEEFRKIQAIQPNFEFAYYGAGIATIMEGRLDEGIKLLEKSSSFPHTNGRPECGLAAAKVMKGDRQAAEAIYARLLKERQASGLVTGFGMASIRAWLGDLDGAVEWLETAIRDHDPSIPLMHIQIESLSPQFARDPRYQPIIDRLGLPH